MRSEISYTLTAHYERARHQNIVWFRQKSTNTITHLEILFNQRIYRVLHLHLYVDVPLKEENLWIAHAYGSSKRGPAGGNGSNSGTCYRNMF